MLRILWGLLLLFSVNALLAQDDFCEESDNKKVKKIYEKLYDRETTDRERFTLLKEAIEIDEYCVQCYFDMGNLSYYVAKQSMKSFDVAKKMFIKAIEVCPTYKADAYYNLALIEMSEGNKATALEYMDQFLNFKSDNDKAFASNHEAKKKYINSIRPELKFYYEWENNIVDYTPERVKNVSSALNEYLPMMSPDNEIMFFTRKEMLDAKTQVTVRENDYVEPLMLAYRADALAEFKEVEKMNDPFSTERFAGLGGVTISVDNHEMIICGCEWIEVDNGLGEKVPFKNCDLYVTHYTLEEDPKSGKQLMKWSDLVPLNESINTNTGWEANPTLSGDGKTLYFAVQRPDMTDIDIYSAERKPDGSWGTAYPVNGLNSNGDDKAPFMHADSKTMYFVSGPNLQKLSDAKNGRSNYQFNRWGAGKFDIYYSRQKEDGSWEKPVLMAKPINTEFNEYGLIVSTDGKRAYFASSRVQGSSGDDIYSFYLYEEARPEEVVILKGKVTDDKGNPVKDAKVEVNTADGEKVADTKVNVDGEYALVVSAEKKKDLVVTTQKKGDFPQTKLIKKEEVEKAVEKGGAVIKETDLKSEKMEKGKSFTLPDILYATASADLKTESKFVLDQLAKFLKENPTVKIVIEGHTDNEGDAAKNMALSDNRAKGVMDYLISKGISSSRLSAKGYGETKPKVSNTSAENKAKNRRTDIVIVSF